MSKKAALLSWALRAFRLRWLQARRSLVSPPLRMTGVQLCEGQRIPWGWGMAYRDFARDTAVCWPLPFNWFVRWVHQLYWFLVWPKKDALEHAYVRGVGQGREGLYDATTRSYNQGFENGKKVVLGLFEAELNAREARRRDGESGPSN